MSRSTSTFIRRVVGIVTGIALLCSVGSAGAQEDAQKVEKLRALLEKASRHLDDDEYENAIEDLEAAREMVDHPKIGLKIGEAQMQLGRCSAARSEFDSLRERDDLGEDLQQRLDAKLDDLESCVPMGHLEVTCDPEGAEIDVRGEEIDATFDCPYSARTPAGELEVRVDADGYVARTRKVELDPQEELTLNVALKSEEKGSKREEASVADRTEETEGGEQETDGEAVAEQAEDTEDDDKETDGEAVAEQAEDTEDDDKETDDPAPEAEEDQQEMDGRAVAERDRDAVTTGGTESGAVESEEVGTPVPEADDTEVGKGSGRPDWQTPVGLSAVGAGAALLTVGAVLDGRAGTRAEELAEARAAGDAARLERLEQQASRVETTTALSYGGGLVLAGGGVTMLLVDFSGETTSPSTVQLGVEPTGLTVSVDW